MRTIRIIVVDLALISIASVLALLLRDNLEFSGERMVTVAPYWLLTAVTAVIVLPILGVTRATWRFSCMRNYIDIVAATGATVVGALAFTFVLNRLEGVPRALPILQGLLIVIFLIGARIGIRLWHARRRRLARSRDVPAGCAGGEAVLVVGMNKLAELYLHCVADFAASRVRIAGVLDTDGDVGLSLLGHPVLGSAEQVADVVRRLEVHGVFVARIVVTVPVEELTPEARDALLALEAGTGISLEFLDQKIGLGKDFAARTKAARPAPVGVLARSESVLAPDAEGARRRSFWRMKRLFDFGLCAVLLVLVAPLMAIVAMVVAIDVGRPVLFWQQRPGRQGRPFRLYKFRTMGAAYDAQGHRRSDAQRLSRWGSFLRRSKLDELPQLFSILVGHMSFVGPRPLLPVDQPADSSARLLVRPGLTGWAQIKGGRIIAPADKAALDMWYVRNASFALDIKILLGTIPMVLFGERVAEDAIVQAWQEAAAIYVPVPTSERDRSRAA